MNIQGTAGSKIVSKDASTQAFMRVICSKLNSKFIVDKNEKGVWVKLIKKAMDPKKAQDRPAWYVIFLDIEF